VRNGKGGKGNSEDAGRKGVIETLVDRVFFPLFLRSTVYGASGMTGTKTLQQCCHSTVRVSSKEKSFSSSPDDVERKYDVHMCLTRVPLSSSGEFYAWHTMSLILNSAQNN